MNKKGKGNGLFEKAVVLAIVAVFIGSAFVPAVGSQVESILAAQSSENEDVKIGNEEIVQLTKNKLNNLEDGSSLWDRLVGMFNRLFDILGNNPIFEGLRELFTDRDTIFDANGMDHDVDYVNDDQLTTEESMGDLESDENLLYDEGADKEIDADGQINKLDRSLDKTRGPRDPLPLGASDLWWNTNWLYRKEITINHTKVDGDQTNFPVLISRFSDGDLASHALDNGSDIVFTDASGNQLNHEIELFNGTNGDFIAWVNVTSLSSAIDTTLYMYYGNSAASNQENPEGVWDSSFMMVQHLNETSGMHYDSTVNHNNASAVSVTTQGSAVGQVDGADLFDPSTNDYVKVPDSNSLDITDAITISAWIYPENLGTTGRIVDKDLSTSYGFFVWSSGGGKVSFYWYDGSTTHQVASSDGSLAINKWQHAVVTYDRSNVRFYINGVPQGSSAQTAVVAANNKDLYIGNKADMSRDFDGTMDEIRISNSARSAGWVNTSFNNQNDTSTFYAVGSEETPDQEPIVSNENPSNGTTNVPIALSELSFTLYDYQNDMNYTVTASPDIIGGSQSDNDITSGTTIHIPVTGGPLAYETVYIWHVNVTDGTHWTNETYSFTTISNTPPILSAENPSNGTTNVPIALSELSFTLYDYQNDMNYTVTASPDIIGGSQSDNDITSGTTIHIPVTGGPLAYETVYIWHVNVTDGTHWTNETYHFTTERKPEAWWNSSWQYRKEIAIDHTKISTDLTDFPVLINITDPDLAAKCQDTGGDIVFTDVSANQLNHEIELFNGSNGQLFAWVNVTSLSSTEDTILYMYYNNSAASNQENPEGVWDSHFLAVHHLEETSGTHYDSTSNDNDGTPYGSLNQNVTGRIDGADYFDGSNDRVVLPQVYSSETVFTIEAWIYPPEVKQGYFISQWSSSNGVFIQEGSTGGIEVYINGVGGLSQSISLNTWSHIVLTYDGSTAISYKNAGTPSSGSRSAPNWPSEGTYIGDRSAGSRQFKGIIDEVRFSDVVRNASWITASYNNQNDPDNFYSIGDERNVHAPVISDENPADGSTGVSDTITMLNFTLADYDTDSMTYTVVTVPDIGSGGGSGYNGTYSVSVSDLDLDTTYTWYVNVTDGTYWTNETFSFTTGVTIDPFERGWNYRRSLTINHNKVTANLSNFPVLIDITDSDLKAHAQPDGDDILFMDGTGVADRLYYEIESYDDSNGHLVAWVNVPSLSTTTDTIIYLYYGNSGASSYEKPEMVWDSDFEGVWHLSETTGGTDAWKDSTSNGYDGTDENIVSSNLDVSGKIDGAVRFDGTNDFINTSLYPDDSKKTLEFWVNFDTLSGDSALGCHEGNHRFYAGVKTDVFDRFYFGMGNAYKLGDDLGGIAKEEWCYLVLSGDQSTARFYINGVEKDSVSYSYTGTSSDSVHIGSRTFGGANHASMFIDGIVDEVRVSYANRSAGWIATCYNNQNDSASFISVGHEAFNSEAPYLTDPSPTDGALFEDLNPTLSIYASDLQGDQMSIKFMTNESGSGWQQIGSTQNGYNNTYMQVTSVFDEHDTKYWWSVNCTDGTYWTNKTCCFTTEPDLPVLSDESPVDGGQGTLNPELSIDVMDHQGDQLTVEFWTNAGGSWQLLGSHTGGNGIYTETGVDMDTLGSTYYWSVNASDAGSGEWVNETYSFTTRLLALKWKTPTSSTIIGPLAADLTDDTGLEIVVTGDGGCVYCLNGTDGSIIWQYCTSGIGSHSPFEIADLNNDGNLEVIVAAGSPLVLHGNNGSLYWRNTSVTADGHYLVVCDINNSGYPTVFVCSGDVTNGWNGNGRVTQMTYDGKVLNQTFAWHPCFGGLSIADCNFDGEFELFMSDRAFNYTHEGVPDGGCGCGMRCFYANNVTPRWNVSNITCSSHCIVLADANNDGVLDAIACDQNCDTDKTGGIAVINVSDGAIIRKEINMGLPSHSNPTVYDIDNDGNLEMIMCSNSQPKVWDLYDWKLDATLPMVCGEPPKVGDVTGDGRMEIIASSGGTITVYDSTYAQIEQVTGLSHVRAFTILQDVDNDGFNELIVPSSSYVYCFDTPAEAQVPLPSTTSQEYGGRRSGAPDSQAPTLRAELPRDGSVLQPLNPELSTLAFDYQYDLINISFKTNASGGSWQEIQGYTDAASGKFTATPTNMNTFETTYFWSVNASNAGSGMWTNKTFSFTTAPFAPVVSDPSPADGAVRVPVTLSKLWFNLTDYQNDDMNYIIGTSPNIGSDSKNTVPNGRYNLSVSNLAYSTVYTWYVNATDGTHWDNVTFSFATELPTSFDPFDNGWIYQKSITIDHTKVADDLTGFPILIDITDTDVKNHAQSDGDDIVFMDGTGVANRLPHEIEFYDNGSGHLVVWVNVSSLSASTNTVIYLYYGNAAALNMEEPLEVWDSDFKAIWHLNETVGGTNAWKDSTGNGYHGTDQDMNQGDPGTDFDASGIDGAVQFDGTDDGIKTLLYPYAGKRTVAFWVNPDSLTGDTTVGCGGGHRFYAGFRYSNAFFGVGGTASYAVSLSLSTGNWYYVVVTANGSTARYYLDGVEKDSFSYTQSGASTDRFMIGFVEGMSQYGYLDGIVDEVRVSYTNRSAGWIATCYNNQHSPGTFYTVGPEKAALVINSTFDSASIGTYTIEGNEINFTLNTVTLVNTGADYTYWTNFKVSNVLNKNVTFRITNADDVPFLSTTSEEAQMVYSYDGTNWNRLTNHSYASGNYTFWKTFTQNDVQIATFLPFSYTEMHDYVDTISSSQWATETVLGSSEQSRDIDLLTITNTSIPIANKKVIYIIGRQHSAETSSSHMLKGMIDFLISSDTDAKRMRDNFVWYIVPMVNPDGVYLGKSRATSENRDPNRDWHPDNHNSIEIDIVRADIISKDENYSIDFFIDWHNQMNDNRWHNFVYSPTGNTFFSILSDWTDFDSQSASGASGCTESYCTARGYIMNNILFDPTFVFEPTPHLYTWTIASLEQEGEYTAFAIDEYFDEPPEIDSVQATPPSVSQDGYVNITCDVTDNDVVDTVKVNISGPAGFTPVNATMSEGSYYYNTSYSVIGNYDYFIWANDTSGNSNMSSVEHFSVTLANQPPTHDTPLLESEFGTDTTDEYLICSNQSTVDPDDDDVYNTYHWFKDGTSLTNLLMSFNTENSTSVKDYSGYDNNGTITGATWTSSGIVGGAYGLDGTDDYISIPDDSTLDGDGTWDEMTMEFWIKSGEDSQTKTTILDKRGVSTSARSYQVGFSSSNPSRIYGAYYLTGGYASSSTDACPVLATGVWYHVVSTYKDGEGIKMYFNGTLANVTSGTGTIKASDGVPLDIGRRQATLDRYMNGDIDEVKIYPFALTAEQINQNYLQSKDGYSSNVTIVSEETSLGDVWKGKVTPSDLQLDGVTKESNTLTIVDITLPEIDSVLATPPSTSQGGYVNITCTVNDNVGVDTVNVSISGPAGFTPVNTSMTEGSYYYNTTYTIIGTYDYFIWANDTGGNSNMSTGHSFSVTASGAPIIVDNSPDTAGTGDDFIVNATVTDSDGVTEAWVEYWFGSGSKTNMSMSNTGGNYWEYDSISIPSNSDDDLYYNISAKDTYDVWGHLDNQHVVVTDDDLPEIDSVLATPPSTSQGGYVNITCIVTDNVGVDTVKVDITGPGGFTPVNTSMTEGSYYYNTTYTIVGTYNYFIWANDTSGNSNMSTGHSFSIVASGTPIIVDNSPDTAGTGDNFIVNVTVTDSDGVTEVWVEYWFGSGSKTNMSMSNTGGNYWEYDSISIPSNSDDDLYYNISAKDTYDVWGHLDNQHVVVTDDDLPEIDSVLATPPSTSQGGYVNITCIVTDNVGVDTVKVDITGPAGFTPVNATMSEGSYYYNTSYSVIGDYDYFIWANDTSGNNNMSSVEHFSVTLANQPPTHDNPLLESELGTDTTDEYLICSNQSTVDPNDDDVFNTHHWFKNGTSLTNLLMSFNTENSTSVKDYSGYDNNGTITGATWTSSGIVGGAYSFDGTDDYISIPDDSTLDGDGTWDEMTIEFWVKSTEDNQAAAIILSKRDASGYRSYQIGFDSNGNSQIFAGFYLDSGYDETSYSDSPVLTTNEWYHVAYTYDDPVINLYINGTLEATSSEDSGNITASDGIPVRLGCRGTGTGNERYLDGVLDHVMIYNYSLSAGQIAEHYTLGYNKTVSQETSVDDVWRCEITPSDGQIDGITKQSNSLTIVDIVPPEIDNVQASPSLALTGEYVNITCAVTDNNNDVNMVKVNITYPDDSNVNETMLIGSYYYNTTYNQCGTYTYFIWANDTSGNSNTSSAYTFSVRSDEMLVDSEFNDSTDSADLRADDSAQDWYESRDDNPTLLTLDISDIAGNTGKKAALKGYGSSPTAYLDQNFSSIQAGTFNVSFDIYIENMSDYSNYDRTGFIFIGDDNGATNGPCSTSVERFVFLVFYDSTPGETGNDLEIRARTLSSQSWGTTSAWTSVATDLSYDTWYTIRLEVDFANSCYDVYINDTLIGDNILGYSGYASSSVTDISFSVGGTARGDFYLDNVFAPAEDRHTLDVTVVGNGSVNVDPGESTYANGTAVELTATADPGWIFSHWYGDHSGSTNPDYVTITDDMTITANFTRLTVHYIDLEPDWNIISIPCYETIDKTDITVRNNSVNKSWNEAVSEGIILGHVYDFDRDNQSYNLVGSLEPGFGYWIWSNYDCELLISSDAVGSGHITDLKEEWDVMGAPYNVTIGKTSTNITNNSIDYSWNDAVAADIILGFVYGWNTTDQMYELCDDFVPGRGYWMYAYYDCTLKR